MYSGVPQKAFDIKISGRYQWGSVGERDVLLVFSVSDMFNLQRPAKGRNRNMKKQITVRDLARLTEIAQGYVPGIIQEDVFGLEITSSVMGWIEESEIYD